MKTRFALFALSALTVSLLLFVINFGPSASAQERNLDRSKDREMAEYLRSVTKRETNQVQETQLADGIAVFTPDFDNVALARNEGDGFISSTCITSLEEANAFFGRNLETGEIAKKTRSTRQTPLARIAADHGMSESEFVFYTDLIQKVLNEKAMSPSAATITIVNNDGAGEGFNDPAAAFANPEGGNTGATRGEQRLNVFNTAGQIWGAFLDSDVPIVVNAQMNPLTCSTGGAVLGSAGTTYRTRDFTGAELTGTWYHAALANKQADTDLNTTTADINTTFNVNIDTGCLAAGSRWYYGLDNLTPSLRINLLVVVLHELGHGLGFSMAANGSTGVLLNGFPDVWSRHMFDTATGRYWNNMTDAERQASAISNGGLLWDGPNVRIASGFLTSGSDSSTGRVQLNTPTTFSSGSSVSHFSPAASPNLLMEPAINPGLPIDGDLTRQLFRDIGWFRDTTGDAIPDTISSVTPNSGNAPIGSVRTISWTNNGSFSRNVTIELSTNNGSTFPTVIASDIPNTGSYNWTVPNMPTSNARIRVREHGFVAPAGVSSQSFFISSTTAASAIVTGRVFDSTGRALRRVTITILDNAGSYRTAITNSFGYYRFDDLRVGLTYSASVRHKTLQFDPRTFTLAENLSDFNFVPR